MDASELDLDARLYKASAELLAELQAKIPLLVKSPVTGSVRRWVIGTKAYEIRDLLDRFQEWPQLLDPYLADLIGYLVDAFLVYCCTSPQDYLCRHEIHDEVIPLPRAIAGVLNAFCKIRGHKVIVRLLNNEPKCIEPLLTCFRLWDSTPSESDNVAGPMIWEERYIMLLWLSHLMLAPFTLSTISGLSSLKTDRYRNITSGLPDVAQTLLELALDHTSVANKAREAASILAVRLALRGDMQAHGLPFSIMSWALSQLRNESNNGNLSNYHYIGLLSLLFGLSNSASDSEASSFIAELFDAAHTLTTSTNQFHVQIRDIAPARKLLVKIMRSTIIHAVSLSSRGAIDHIDVDVLLEDCIQSLLDSLTDKDTPIRQAASKALSLIALQLDTDMSAQIGEAVLGTLDENVLLEDSMTGELILATDRLRDQTSNFKKNVNAVDPLKWHGAMLTLGHLLFRRALPASQLPDIIEALLIGLEFEQRSNVGTSIGVGVRDAACFGLWSLARKYSTAELGEVEITPSMLTDEYRLSNSRPPSVIQLVANHLVASACLDPSGNLRRGSSAALQELIGRHPDVVLHGIPVVQVIDYHAVARRSRAMTEVTVAVARLDTVYHQVLLYALLQWRGARATDADSRRQASQALGPLTSMCSISDVPTFTASLIMQIHKLKQSNVGSNAAARHGYLACLSTVLRSSGTRASPEVERIYLLVLPLLRDLSSLTGGIDGRVTSDVENVLEAISSVVAAAIALTRNFNDRQDGADALKDWIMHILPVLERCTMATDSDFVAEATAEGYLELATTTDLLTRDGILRSWLDETQQNKNEFVCKGRIVVLGTLFAYASSRQDLHRFGTAIIDYLCNIIVGHCSIETKVNATRSIERVLSSIDELVDADLRTIRLALVAGLSDYTIDQRGDVGSLLRLESIRAAQLLLDRKVDNEANAEIQGLIVRLAIEKLAKVRYQAWNCVKTFWVTCTIGMEAILPFSPPPLEKSFEHQADVSSFAYFKTMLQIIPLYSHTTSLTAGLAGTVTAGVDDASRACTEAIVSMVSAFDTDARRIWIKSIFQQLESCIANTPHTEDRVIVSIIDFMAILLEHVVPVDLIAAPTSQDNDRYWTVSQKMHRPASSIERLEALLRLYAAMAQFDDLRVRALDRMSRMLLHRWPKIRTLAAEYIWLHSSPPSMLKCDWNGGVKECKPVVLQCRRELNILTTAPRTVEESAA